MQDALVCRSIRHEKNAAATPPEGRELLAAQENASGLGKARAEMQISPLAIDHVDLPAGVKWQASAVLQGPLMD